MNWLWDLVKSLKISSILVVFVVWNAIGLVGLSLNGGYGPIRTLAGGLVMALECALLAGAAAAVAVSPAWQRRVLRPDADVQVARPGLWFIVVIASLLAIGGGISSIALM
jgi:hypothetical protein